jgi:membrane protein
MAQVTLREGGSDRGRQADSPGDIPRRGWRDIAWRVKEQLSKDQLSIISAGVAFYTLLAVFPAMIAGVALYGLAFDPQQVARHVEALAIVLPTDAAEVLFGQLADLTERDTTAMSIGAIVGIVLALWTGSLGIRTLMQALNIAYNEEERRGFLRFYATALALTLGSMVGFVIAVGMVVAVPAILNLLGLEGVLGGLIRYTRWPILGLMMMLWLAVIFRFAPSREQARWRWVSWGAVIATVLWLIGSAGFSLYVTHFANYNETYGSMGAGAILLTWMLLTAYAILLGAEINSEMERQTAKDTTTGKPQPIGQRGAYAADTVGESH